MKKEKACKNGIDVEYLWQRGTADRPPDSGWLTYPEPLTSSKHTMWRTQQKAGDNIWSFPLIISTLNMGD